METYIYFRIEIAPADRIRLPFSGSGDFGMSPLFGQHLVKLINSTVRQRTILVAQCPANSRPASPVVPDLLLQRGRRVM
jgi:hypothetical protein